MGEVGRSRKADLGLWGWEPKIRSFYTFNLGKTGLLHSSREPVGPT